MKQLLLFLTLVSYTLDATNLLVKEYGVNNTYETIQSAIDASSHGDTIIVYDKPSGQWWVEDLIISKEIFLVNSDQGNFDRLSGSIEVVPSPGLTFNFRNINLEQYEIFANSGVDSLLDRCTINIVNCVFRRAKFNQDGLAVNLYGNHIKHLELRHGQIIHNRLNFLRIYEDDENQNDSLIIIANRHWNHELTMWINTKASLRVFNNYFRCDMDNGNTSGYEYVQGGSKVWTEHGINWVALLYIENCNSERLNFIENNSMHAFDFSPYYPSYIKIENNSKFNIVNNYMMWNNNDVTKTICGGDQDNSFISHNHWYTGNSYCYPEVNNEYNKNEHCDSFDSFGRNQCSSNDGHYLPKYNDIDLSRNDTGTDGGSYSINNYENQSGDARIYYLDVPNFVNLPQEINIKGSGAIVD